MCRRVRGTVPKGFTNISAARLPQLALAEFLESGGFEKHIRQQVLTLFPTGMRASLPEGGFVLWIQLPAGYDGHEVQQLAANIGINILPGAVFSPSGQYKNCIRLNCGHPIEILEPAIKALAALL